MNLKNYDGDIKLNIEDVILVNKEEGIITSVEGSKIFVTFSNENIERKSFIGKTLSIIRLYNIENERYIKGITYLFKAIVEWTLCFNYVWFCFNLFISANYH